jgi:hypothetical protein
LRRQFKIFNEFNASDGFAGLVAAARAGRTGSWMLNVKAADDPGAHCGRCGPRLQALAVEPPSSIAMRKGMSVVAQYPRAGSPAAALPVHAFDNERRQPEDRKRNNPDHGCLRSILVGFCGRIGYQEATAEP